MKHSIAREDQGKRFTTHIGLTPLKLLLDYMVPCSPEDVISPLSGCFLGGDVEDAIGPKMVDSESSKQTSP